MGRNRLLSGTSCEVRTWSTRKRFSDSHPLIEPDLTMFIFSSTNEVEKMNMERSVVAIIRLNPVEVDNRLEALGWTRAEMYDVVDAMVDGRRGCTENDPSSAPGWMAWKSGTRRLREVGRARRMEKAEIEGIPYVIDLKNKVRFTVANTDDGTCIKLSKPQNYNKKGPATERSISAQGELFEHMDEPKVAKFPQRRPGFWVTWYLCVYCEGDEIRAELSCPVAVEGGYFKDFYERIFLVGGDGDDPMKVRRNEPDDGSEFDIPVIRRK